MAISDEYIEELRRRADVESIISSYVSLKRSGKISRGLCPFHGEKTPSFTVYPDTQSYYCFGCGAGGDVINFIKNIENLDYIESIKFLAEKVGMDLPDEGSYDASMQKRKLRILEANREAARFYYRNLTQTNNNAGLGYCSQRKLNKDSITRFGLGFALDEWSSLKDHLMKQGFKENELLDADLLKKSSKGTTYDTFRNRLVFPIIDLRGNVLGFSGRRLDENDPKKYVNTADTIVYKKGNEVYGLNIAKKSKEPNLILCEGNIDVVMLHQAGFDNAVAGLGTALTAEQAQLLSRYASEILICYDNDDAGTKATTKAINLFSKTNANVKVLTLSGGKDPDEIIKTHGVEYFRSLLEQGSNEIEFELLKENKKINISTDDGKRQYIMKIIPYLAKLSPIELEIYASRLEDELKIVSKQAIIQEVNRQRKKTARQEEKKKYEEIRTKASRLDSLNKERKANMLAAKAEESIILSLLLNSKVLEDIEGKVSPDDFVTEFNKKIFTVLSSRIREGRSVEFINLHDELSDAEITGLSAIRSEYEAVKGTAEEAGDFIEVLKKEKKKKDIKSGPADEISDSDFLKFFEND
ncbi:MAG: DNA primase [Clostridiales bacterium]|nr:DNA primase [Clostridiales bacterium]